MKSLRKKLLSAILTAALVLAFLPFVPKGNGNASATVSGETNDVTVYAAGEAENSTEPVTIPDAGAEAKEEKAEITAEKLAAMLDINYCYNKSFDSDEALRGCAAMSLSEYSTDFDGYGFCVSSAFLDAFVNDFYGKMLFEYDSADSAPEGYVAVPECESGTFCHIPVSLKETDGVFEIITRMEYYDGGNDRDSHLVKSRFIENGDSAFGVNLVFSEIL